MVVAIVGAGADLARVFCMATDEVVPELAVWPWLIVVAVVLFLALAVAGYFFVVRKVLRQLPASPCTQAPPGRCLMQVSPWTQLGVCQCVLPIDERNPDAQSDDRIADFGFIGDVISGGNELIDLSAIDAITGTDGDDAFTFIGDDLFSDVAGELRAFEGADGFTHVLADVNGDSTADMEILVFDNFEPVVLEASDFAL